MSFSKKEYENYKRQGEKAKFKSPEEELVYALTQMKKCSKCGINKCLNEYNGNTSGCDAFDREGYRLRRPECKICTKNVCRGKSEAKAFAKKQNIPYKAPQGTLCAICNLPEKKGDALVFDHCHSSNKFRGYLHNSCNRSLGVLGDNISGLLRAMNYLNKTEKIKINQNPEDFSLNIAS